MQIIKTHAPPAHLRKPNVIAANLVGTFIIASSRTPAPFRT
jgi:hypothetical protein